MLDQNTDRMWYVIGAVLIGAAIIFGMNTLMPNAFASVSENFTTIIQTTKRQIPHKNMFMNGTLDNNGLGWKGRTELISENQFEYASSNPYGFVEIYQDIELINGHKYYVSMNVDAPINNNELRISYDILTHSWINYPPHMVAWDKRGPINGYLSNVHTYIDETKLTQVGLKVQPNPQSTYFIIDDLVIIDLTDHYGVGFEPTKDEMDALIQNK